MNEFDEFRRIEVPDRWDEIVSRAEAPEDSTAGRARRGRSALILLGAIAAVMAMFAGFLVVDRNPRERIVTPDTNPTVAESVMDPPSPDPSATELPITAPLAGRTQGCASETDLTEVGDLFRSGQPTYDHTPARDLAELVARATVVVAGTVAAVRRERGGRETYTVYDVEDVEVLAGGGDVESFVTSSVWPFPDEPDPLEARVELDAVRFVAFLVPLDLNSAPGRWQPSVEGFAFGCAGRPAESLAGLPPDLTGRTVEEIVALVR